MKNEAEIDRLRQQLTYYVAGYTQPHIAAHRHLWRIDYHQGGKTYYVCAICHAAKRRGGA